MKPYVLSIAVLFAINGYSQPTLNNYKYVLVPDRYDFTKEDNQYRLNTTTKALLEQKGFTAFVGNEPLPPLVATNKCNALRVEVVEKKSLFVTNLTLLLKDCQGNVIFKSKQGKSREKEFPVAYDMALRDAFTSLNDVAYNYDSTAIAQPVAAVPIASSSAPASATSPSATSPSAASASIAAASAASSSVPVPAATPAAIAVEITGTLYAQVVPNGYQLIDTSPKKVLTLLKTSIEDHFIAEGGGTNGIVFKKNGSWFFEYYKENKLISQKLDIKF